MGILNRGIKGFNYKTELWMIRCYEDAVKATQRMTAAQHYMFIEPGKYGLPIQDIRIQWIQQTCGLAQEFNMRNRKLGKDKPAIKVSCIKQKLVLNDLGDSIDEYVRIPDGVRICGAQLRAHEKGWLCQQYAGSGTNHKGYGFCYHHEGDVSMNDTKEFWKKLHRSNQAKTLSDFINAAEEIIELDNTIDADLKYLEIIRQAAFKRVCRYLENTSSASSNDGNNVEPDGIVTEKDIRLLKDVTVAITQTKKTKHFVESRGMIPATQVPQMIIQVLQTVTAGETDAVRDRIVGRAMNLQGDIVFPVLDTPGAVPEYEGRHKNKITNSLKQALKNDSDWPQVAPVKPKIKEGTLEYSDEKM